MCWSNARSFFCIRFLIHRRFRIAFFLLVHFERVFSCWRRLFWKGAACFECAEVHGARAAVPKTAAGSHQQPTAYVAECSTFDASIIQNGRPCSNTRCPIHISYVYTSSSIQSAPGAFLFLSRPACCSFLYCPFLPGLRKRDYSRRGNFLNLSKKLACCPY